MKTFDHLQDIPLDFTGQCIVRSSHATFWLVNGDLHREDGPAALWDTGSKTWYYNGLRHRLDGPAYECCTGNKKYYLRDILLSEQEFYNHPLYFEYKLNLIYRKDW